MSLLERLQHIPDPRIHRRRRHDLIDLLAIALCATIGGADNWVEVAQFGQAHHDWFKRFLRLPSGIASHDTFARVFRLLDEQALEAACLEWMRSAAGQVKGVVAIDGKTVCGATPAGSSRPALHMLSAWAADMGVLLGQCKVDGKSNEITAIPKLLKLLDVQGCIVTIDAMGCQKAIAEHIVEQGADYVLTLKANQRHLHGVCKKHFASEEAPSTGEQVYSEEVNGHSRKESRHYWVTPIPESMRRAAKAWAGIKCLVRVQRTRQCAGKVASESTSYYISSLPANTPAKVLAHSIRSHWQVENALHWSLDVSFSEDASRVRKDNAAHNLALMRRLALGQLKADKTLKVGIQSKRRRAGWDLGYLGKVMGWGI